MRTCWSPAFGWGDRQVRRLGRGKMNYLPLLIHKNFLANLFSLDLCQLVCWCQPEGNEKVREPPNRGDRILCMPLLLDPSPAADPFHTLTAQFFTLPNHPYHFLRCSGRLGTSGLLFWFSDSRNAVIDGFLQHAFDVKIFLLFIHIEMVNLPPNI